MACVLIQWFPNFVFCETLQVLFWAGKEPPPELPSKHKRFITQTGVIKISYSKQIMHNKNNHKT